MTVGSGRQPQEGEAGPQDRSWMVRGKCHPTKPYLAHLSDLDRTKFFYPARTNERATQEAVEFCAGCPVAGRCLKFAVEHVDPGVTNTDLTGVFGGRTPQQRAKDRKNLREQGRRK